MQTKPLWLGMGGGAGGSRKFVELNLRINPLQRKWNEGKIDGSEKDSCKEWK